MSIFSIRAIEDNVQDCELLFSWVNDSVARQNAFTTDVISYDNHKKWFKSVVNNPEVLIYVMEENHIPVGQVRINKYGTIGLIDFSVDSRYRGQGIGKKMIATVEKIVRQNGFVTTFKAEVKKSNIASQRVFEFLRYRRCENLSFFTYTKVI